ncbi:DUF223 domain protein [Spatholobus suberectus]|nr:DUF223 domain protein [Spatholobus suberectus]
MGGASMVDQTRNKRNNAMDSIKLSLSLTSSISNRNESWFSNKSTSRSHMNQILNLNTHCVWAFRSCYLLCFFQLPKPFFNGFYGAWFSFSYFWKEKFLVGDAELSDLEGKIFAVHISEREDGMVIFYSGMSKVATFYQLITDHEVCWHYKGENQFEMKLFSVDNIEVVYPVLLDDSNIAFESEGDELNEVVPNEREDVVNNEIYKSWPQMLSEADIYRTQTMVIPARIVKDFIPKRQKDIFVQHYGGQLYTCTLRGGARRVTECYLANGWFENGNISSSQVISLMSGHSAISLGDDLLQTQRLTVSDVIETTEDNNENEADTKKELSTQVDDNIEVCMILSDSPSSKSSGKRSTNDLDKSSLFEDSETQASTTKIAKVAAIKMEPVD